MAASLNVQRDALLENLPAIPASCQRTSMARAIGFCRARARSCRSNSYACGSCGTPASPTTWPDGIACSSVQSFEKRAKSFVRPLSSVHVRSAVPRRHAALNASSTPSLRAGASLCGIVDCTNAAAMLKRSQVSSPAFSVSRARKSAVWCCCAVAQRAWNAAVSSGVRRESRTVPLTVSWMPRLRTTLSGSLSS
jgi:hypothetical protein